MALNKIELEKQILKLLNDMSKIEKKPENARKLFASQLATIIDNYVKSATIIATPEKILAAGLSNSAGPVVAANNLICSIT